MPCEDLFLRVGLPDLVGLFQSLVVAELRRQNRSHVATGPRSVPLDSGGPLVSRRDELD